MEKNKDVALSIIHQINSIKTDNLSKDVIQNLQNIVRLISGVIYGKTEKKESKGENLPFINLDYVGAQSVYELEKAIKEKKYIKITNNQLHSIIDYIKDDKNNIKTLSLYSKIISLPKEIYDENIEAFNIISNTIRNHFHLPMGVDKERIKSLQLNEIFKGVNTKYDLAKLYKKYIGESWDGNNLLNKGKFKSGNKLIISYEDFSNKFNENLKKVGIKNFDVQYKALGEKGDWFYNCLNGLGLYEWFNPENFEDYELEILKIDSEKFYEGYDYTKEEIKAHHYYKRGRIIENIQMYVQNVIKQKREIGKREIIEKVRSDLITLPKEEKIDIFLGIGKVVDKFNKIRKYLDFKNSKYKNPKALLCAMRGITDKKTISSITNGITVQQHGVGLTFFVDDIKSYQIIYDNSLKDSGRRSGGFNCAWSGIPELSGTLSVVNGKNPGNNINDYKYGTILHEGQHNRNTYFMPDKYQGPINYAKDEITAFLRDGRSTVKIEEYLTQSESDGGLYQYGLVGEERKKHKAQVRTLLKYARDLLNLIRKGNGIRRDRIISMLSDTPVESRKYMHDEIMKAVKNGKNINNLWWSGSAKKETEIKEINNAKSIKEIKRILNDPKYSHISRAPNNKGGIEISAIIDRVVAGKLAITYIPQEIRPKIQKFIKK